MEDIYWLIIGTAAYVYYHRNYKTPTEYEDEHDCADEDDDDDLADYYDDDTEDYDDDDE